MRTAMAVASAILCVAAVVAAPPAAVAAACPQPVSTVRAIDRVAGPDRYATAACASQAVFPTGSVDTVVLARGDNAGGFADALAGTVLADAVGGPTLLTDPDVFPAATRAEIQRLAPARVIVLGGVAAVSDGVVTEIRNISEEVTVERISGTDRYVTAAAVSAAAGSADTAFIVSGSAPADALLAGAPAARQGAKLLLTGRDAVPAATLSALAGVRDIVIVGGYGVVSQAVETQLGRVVGTARVTRVSGANRHETAASVARHFAVDGRVHVVNGGNASTADVISAGWMAARTGGGAIVYTERDRPGQGADRYLRLGGLSATGSIRLVGGGAVLSDDLVGVLEERYVEVERGGPAPQMRAFWVHLFDNSLKSGAGIDAVLDAAAGDNLNTVIVEVVRRQDAYYTSQVLPRTPDPALPADLDVLARVLSAAHDRGISVHAWYPALPAWHPAYQELVLPLWEAHGIGSADPWVSVTHEGTQGTFFDPGVPAVADHVVAVARELATRYAIDAVHLDYLRYESQDWGYHPESLERFRAAYGLADSYLPAVDDWRWDAWRREQTRAISQRISDAVHTARPQTAVTLAGSTIGEPPLSSTDYTNTRTWGDVFQAWPQWLATGTIDAVFPMNYFRESTHASYFDDWVAFEERLHRDCESVRPPCVVAVGLAAYLNTASESQRQLGQALAATDGAVLFSYQTDTVEGTSPLLGTLHTTVFPAPAPAPALR